MHGPALQDILIILVFSVVIVYVMERLKLPSILGLLITGLVIGPFGFSLIQAVEQVEMIAEIGVILLLFIIGMELSISHLMSIRKTVLAGGLMQVGFTVLATAALEYLAGYTWSEAVFGGFLFSLSSTAIVLKILQDRNEISSPHGRNALAILIFQDIIVVPMMLVTPIVAGETSNVTLSLLSLLLKSTVVIAITVISAKYLVPQLMSAITRTRSKELFLLTNITICFAVAFLTSATGLSLALGAFLAGLIISESEYSHQATSVILPFRELFTSFFFISVGMLMNIRFFFDHFWIILLLGFMIFILKSLLASFAIWILKYPLRTALLTGLSLFQVGEFAFILSKTGIQYGLLSEETNQYFLAVSILTMFLTPFVIMFSHRLSDSIAASRIGKTVETLKIPNLHLPVNEEKLNQHLVIIGFGVNGSNVSKAAQKHGIPHIVIELDAELVREARNSGVPVIFGDAAQPHILEAVDLLHARAVVIAISDPVTTKRITVNIRQISKTVYLLVRTRYVKEIPELIVLGADDVIPEEFETSIEIFTRVLQTFMVKNEDIQHFAETLRDHNYSLFQSSKKPISPRL